MEKYDWSLGADETTQIYLGVSTRTVTAIGGPGARIAAYIQRGNEKINFEIGLLEDQPKSIEGERIAIAGDEAVASQGTWWFDDPR